MTSSKSGCCAGSLQPPGAVIDVVYRSGGTAFVQAATALGIPAVDGREMLVAQGALLLTVGSAATLA